MARGPIHKLVQIVVSRPAGKLAPDIDRVSLRDLFKFLIEEFSKVLVRIGIVALNRNGKASERLGVVKGPGRCVPLESGRLAMRKRRGYGSIGRYLAMISKYWVWQRVWGCRR